MMPDEKSCGPAGRQDEPPSASQVRMKIRSKFGRDEKTNDGIRNVGMNDAAARYNEVGSAIAVAGSHNHAHLSI